MAFADDLSALTVSVDSWELAGVIMAAVVAISVAGEVTHDFELFWSIGWWRLKGGKASGLILIAALVAEVVIQINVNSINGRIIALLEMESARLNERAEEAAKAAATANERAARLEKEAAELQAVVAGRQLSQQEAGAICEELRSFAGNNVDI